jgi:hypothetical protein
MLQRCTSWGWSWSYFSFNRFTRAVAVSQFLFSCLMLSTLMIDASGKIRFIGSLGGGEWLNRWGSSDRVEKEGVCKERTHWHLSSRFLFSRDFSTAVWLLVGVVVQSWYCPIRSVYVFTLSDVKNTKSCSIHLLIKKLRGLVRQRTIPTERPPLVGEVSANFSE